MKQAQNQEKGPPWQNNRLGNAFRAVTQEINPRLEKPMLSDLGFCFCLKQIGKANHSQVDYFANKPAILGFAGSRVGSTNCASHPPPARKGNSNVTNARAHAAFLDTRAAHTRIRISTPNLGVLIYVYRYYKQANPPRRPPKTARLRQTRAPARAERHRQALPLVARQRKRFAMHGAQAQPPGPKKEGSE